MTLRKLAPFALALTIAGCSDGTTEIDRGDAGHAADTAVVVDAGADAATITDAASSPDAATDLDAATIADAGSTRAGPDAVGPYTVMRTSTMRTGYTAVAFVPSLPAGTQAPLVVFKHGFQLSSTNYAMLLERVASHGFVVVGVDTSSGLIGGPTNIDERDAILHAIDWSLSGAPFAAQVDGAHIAVMGHSRGGKDAVLAAAADPRITAALLLDPVNGCGPGMGFRATCPDASSAANAGALAIPVGVMGETNDGSGGFMPCAPTAQNYSTIYAGIHASPWAVEWTFATAVHMTFTDDGGGFAGSLCAMEPLGVADVRANIRTMAVAFARYHLRGETDMAPWLIGASVPSDVTQVGP